jgi:hypothetical protein
VSKGSTDASANTAVEETAHYGNGRIKYTGFLLHGAWSWYRTDGSLMRSGEFDRGKQIGTWRTYDRSGKVVKETSFAMMPASIARPAIVGCALPGPSRCLGSIRRSRVDSTL